MRFVFWRNSLVWFHRAEEILASGTADRLALAVGLAEALGSDVGGTAKFGNSWICSLELEVPLLFKIVGGSG